MEYNAQVKKKVDTYIAYTLYEIYNVAGIISSYIFVFFYT